MRSHSPNIKTGSKIEQQVRQTKVSLKNYDFLLQISITLHLVHGSNLVYNQIHAIYITILEYDSSAIE